MNKNQKIALIVVAIIILLMLLFPPFHLEFKGQIINRGYGFVFDPPEIATVNAGMLLVQWFGVLIIGGLIFLLLK